MSKIIALNILAADIQAVRHSPTNILIPTGGRGKFHYANRKQIDTLVDVCTN
jgi:hypothetical protein